MSKIKKSAVEAAKDTKELRSLAAKAGVKFIGKKTEDLRKELLAIAEPDGKKPAAKKTAKKAAEKKAVAKKAAVKKETVKKEVVKVPADRLKEILALPTKKARVITLREEKFPVNAIAEAVGMHPTNVSRYIREAGLSTSTAVVPQERKDRIKATIASKKSEKTPAAAKKAAAKPAAKASKKAEKPPAKGKGKGKK